MMTVGDRGEGDVSVPSGPGSAFEVVQAEAVFEFAVVVFDPPALQMSEASTT
jgi:hypothetical protein